MIITKKEVPVSEHYHCKRCGRPIYIVSMGKARKEGKYPSGICSKCEEIKKEKLQKEVGGE